MQLPLTDPDGHEGKRIQGSGGPLSKRLGNRARLLQWRGEPRARSGECPTRACGRCKRPFEFPILLRE